jgi:hypothetical protein
MKVDYCYPFLSERENSPVSVKRRHSIRLSGLFECISLIKMIKPIYKWFIIQTMKLEQSFFFPFSRFDCGFAVSGRFVRAFCAVLCFALSVLLSSCGSISPVPTRVTASSPEKDFHVDMPKKVQDYATPQKIDAVTPHENYKYTLGPGDVVNIQVWHRPELSGACGGFS